MTDAPQKRRDTTAAGTQAFIEERKQQDPEYYYFGHGSTSSLDNIFGNRNTITSEIFTGGTASDVV